MTGLYVNSNPTAMTAQYSLTRNMGALSDTLTRLSTGYKINSAKDDPAGLIASELLKSDIAGTSAAIKNVQRANSVLSAADSGMANIGNLLTNIKSLVVEAASTGSMNADQIAANQLQVDSTLEAIDKIATSTNYGGNKLLDGSMDFTTSICGTNGSDGISNLSVTSANFGTQNKIDVTVDVQQEAKRGTLIYNGNGVNKKTTLDITGSVGTASITVGTDGQYTSNQQIADAINFYTDSTGVQARVEGKESRGNVILSSAGANNDILVTATKAGYEAGNLQFEIVEGTWDAADVENNIAVNGNVVTITIADDDSTTASQVVGALNKAGAILDADGNANTHAAAGLFQATNLAGDDGTGLVHAQGASAVWGNVNLDNAIRFTGAASGLGADDGPIVRLIAGEANQELGVALYTAGSEDSTTERYNGLADGQRILEVRLKTDADGNSITTAAELASFFDSLKELGVETGGVSAEVVYPPGADPNGRVWNVDECGNVTETSLCNATYGTGIVDPTRTKGPCEVNVENDIWLMGATDKLVQQSVSTLIDATTTAGATGLDLTIEGRNVGTEVAGTEITIVRAGETPAQAAQLDDKGNVITYGVDKTIGAVYDADNKRLTLYLASGQDVTNANIASFINGTNGIREHFKATATAANAAEVIDLPAGSSAVNSERMTGAFKIQDENGEDKYDADGVTANADYTASYISMLGNSDSNERLVIEATEYGSDHFVKVATREGSFRTFCPLGLEMCELAGTDVQATVNGLSATGKGNTISLNTADLAMSFDVDGPKGEKTFSITGGGALFQIGPNVVSAQQKRIGIGSMLTTSIGGESGKLFELKTGGRADLITSDASRKLADRIINESVSYVANTRGRIGALQSSLLDPMQTVLEDQKVTLTESLSMYQDADFAEESSNLTRLQLLVQSGISTLGIANQFPQYAASLVR